MAIFCNIFRSVSFQIKIRIINGKTRSRRKIASGRSLFAKQWKCHFEFIAFYLKWYIPYLQRLFEIAKLQMLRHGILFVFFKNWHQSKMMSLTLLFDSEVWVFSCLLRNKEWKVIYKKSNFFLFLCILLALPSF